MPSRDHTNPLRPQATLWCLAMKRGVTECISACPVHATNKVFHEPVSGQLYPLPVPHCPWSNISLDFVTGLPLSEGHTTVLTVVDGFSKMVHFIQLPKLPLAKCYIMSPGTWCQTGVQEFVSQFWKEICSLLGATVSLSSSFHR